MSFESKEGLGKVCTASFGARHDVVPKLFSVPILFPLPSQAKIWLPPSFYCEVWKYQLQDGSGQRSISFLNGQMYKIA
jgi:hypothetical protein